MNDSSPVEHTTYHYRTSADFVNRQIDVRHGERLVDIHGWCLMRNHYHLLVSERVEGGLTTFLRKLNIGYANYFNEKHTHSGSLFQGRTKRIPVSTDAQFSYILHYIHANPLDYLTGAEGWRGGGSIDDATQAMRYLTEYRWSSFRDYIGIKGFPSLITTNLFSGVFQNYRDSMQRFLDDRERENTPALWLE